ncbi:N-acetylmuramoyl-L-alanine amidase [Loktanella salsilacus]|uniref:N-acetylmuramoyl-L-alanine amidase n=1 Tax=Loktanella salsilacus TaxID=195913 RepID=UPI0020B88657|nr:N-acetylmuramoyl-L-alanine amidase [Loktanella salsilacus]UTH48962.1 N-acetylmuramoyl-L-alanine amidase [Loktanella salsilacus]
MVVIHYTAMTSAAAACNTLCNPDTEVSAHYLIAQDGAVHCLVPEDMRAWHAGAGRWGAVTDVNSSSIGIELANPGNCPFAAAQMDALCDLLAGITDRWAIRPARIIGHSDMAPGRKIDPGARFDWQRLVRLGLSIWPAPHGEIPGTTDFRPLMQRFGYTADAPDDVLLSAFRLRFRPRATGPLCAADMALIADLAHRFPVDDGTVTA